MRKKFTMLLMSLLACVGVAKAQTATIVASTNVDCPETQYAIKSGNGYWMYKTGAPTDNNPGRFAFFAAEGENAYKIYSLDLKQWVSYDPAQISGNIKDFTTLIDSQEDAKSWHVTSSQNGNRACYQFQPYNANGEAQDTYMNWNGGVNVGGGFAYQDGSKRIGLWEDAASNDGGSAWMLTHVVAPETGEYALKDICHETYLDIHNLGVWPDGPSYTQLATMQDEWQPLYITVSGNGWDWSIHTTAEGGNYLHQTSDKQWNSWVSADGASFVWKAELFIKEAKATELYYALRHESGSQNGYLGSDSHADGNVLYVNQQDAAKKLRFTLIDADELRNTVKVVYNFTYKGEIKHTQETEILKGEEFPEFDYSAPWGIRIAGVKPAGTVSSTTTMAVELIDSEEFPFEFSDSYANAVWYYMPLHSTGKYYLGYVADQTSITLSDAQKVLPEEGHDAYLWAFVGDPFTGYKIMNKAAGDSKILSSSETMSANNGETTYPLMVDGTSVPAGNNTYWIPSVSNHATNGFYLEQKGKSSNKMNRRGSNLAYWSGGADGGSTFRVTTLATEEDVIEAHSLMLFAGKVGYPKEGIDVENELLAWTVGRATKLDVAVAVSNYKKSTNIVLPEDGKAYKIYNYSHYDANGDGVGTTRYLNYTAGQALSVNEDYNKASVFVCKQLSDGTYAFVTEDGKVLTWMHGSDGYKENEKHNGYSSNYATEYSGYSDWNKITVKKNGSTEDDFGYLRLVARRYSQDNNPYSSFIIQGNTGTWDRAGDSYFFQTPQDNKKCFSSAWILSEVKHTNTDAENLAVAKIAALGVRYGLLAEGIGGYHYMLNGAENYSWATVRDAVYAMNSVADVENVTFGINQPAAGFYRIKSMNANDANKKGKNLLVSDGALALDKAEDATSIMYIDAANAILNYSSGLYINTYAFPAEVGAQAVGWNFIENAQVAGTYTLEYNDNAGGQMDYYLSDWTGNVTYGQNDANAAWIFEEVTSLPVAVSAVGYATLYAPVALAIPADVKVYTATINENGVTLDLAEVKGTIPANTGVLLEAEKGIYNFTVAEDVERIEDNKFVGNCAKSMAKTDVKVYTLQNIDEQVGFYRYSTTSTKPINQFRAWIELDLESTVQALRFTRGDDATGIESVEANEELVIFDLAGRRVQKMEKGIYIVNGKKVVIK